MLEFQWGGCTLQRLDFAFLLGLSDPISVLSFRLRGTILGLRSRCISRTVEARIKKKKKTLHKVGLRGGGGLAPLSGDCDCSVHPFFTGRIGDGDDGHGNAQTEPRKFRDGAL